MSPLASYMVQAGLTLVGIAVLGSVLVFGARRFGATVSPGPMRLMARLPLDGRRALYLVRVGERYLVLGASESGIAKLADLDEAPSAPPTPAPASFAELLAGLSGKARPEPRDEGTANE